MPNRSGPECRQYRKPMCRVLISTVDLRLVWELMLSRKDGCLKKIDMNEREKSIQKAFRLVVIK